MLRYAVENTREESVTVDGLGVLPPKSVNDFTSDDAESFRYMRGLPLSVARMPEGVSVTIHIGADK